MNAVKKKRKTKNEARRNEKATADDHVRRQEL